MILKNMKNPKHIHRIFLMLLLLVFTFTSSLVHAQDTSEPDFTVVQETFLSPLIIPEEGDSNLYIDTFEDTSFSSPGIPLAQEITMTALSTDNLYQGTDYDSFFEHTVFVGDSLSVGFQNYCTQHSDSIASKSTYFLARQSGSAKAAISSNALTTFSNIMPEYNGKVQLIEDSISQMPDIEKVFICYGMNDLVSSTPEQFAKDLKSLIQKVLNKNPQVTIYVLSVPCIMKDVQTGGLSNSSIQAANALLSSTCTENQWGFVNIAEYLMNQENAIYENYSSDGYVHENNAAYREWIKVLRNYAYEMCNG